MDGCDALPDAKAGRGERGDELDATDATRNIDLAIAQPTNVDDPRR
jgi:hypothetical protein